MAAGHHFYTVIGPINFFLIVLNTIYIGRNQIIAFQYKQLFFK